AAMLIGATLFSDSSDQTTAYGPCREQPPFQGAEAHHPSPADPVRGTRPLRDCKRRAFVAHLEHLNRLLYRKSLAGGRCGPQQLMPAACRTPRGTKAATVSKRPTRRQNYSLAAHVPAVGAEPDTRVSKAAMPPIKKRAFSRTSEVADQASATARCPLRLMPTQIPFRPGLCPLRLKPATGTAPSGDRWAAERILRAL